MLKSRIGKEQHILVMNCVSIETFLNYYYPLMIDTDSMIWIIYGPDPDMELIQAMTR